MAGINKAIVVGNLGKDPEMRYMADGTACANFSVATSETWKDKNTGEKKEKVEWHRVVVWRQLAEICGKYLVKGKQVYIEGKLQTRSWEKDGVTHYTTEIVADKMVMLGSAGGEQRSAAPAASRPQAAAPRQQADEYVPAMGDYSGSYSDDDVPF
jgi:single-strand DNA-binding protein